MTPDCRRTHSTPTTSSPVHAVGSMSRVCLSVCVCVVLRSLIQSATCRDYRLQMYTQYSSHQRQQQPSTTLPVHAADTPASTGISSGGLSSADGGKRRASVGGDRLSSAETVGGSDGDSGTSSAKRPRCHDDEQSAAAAVLQSVQHTRSRTRTYTHTQPFNGPLSRTIQCLQCFDAVGWAAGRASGL